MILIDEASLQITKIVCVTFCNTCAEKFIKNTDKSITINYTYLSHSYQILDFDWVESVG